MTNHHPMLLWARRVGSWCYCSCGWRGATYWSSVVGAHLEYGGHLLDVVEGSEPLPCRS